MVCARKCGHGLREGGQPRFSFQLLLVVPAQSIQICLWLAFLRQHDFFSRTETQPCTGALPTIFERLFFSLDAPERPALPRRFAHNSHRFDTSFHPVSAMASQQILFAETIAGMKKAFKRKSYESDSDSEIESYSNRGNKLKKQARFARQGQLVPNNGPSSYKEYVEYGGVRRPILYRNPPLVDEEGYEIDSDDEDEERVQEAEASAAEMNPYANIQIESKSTITHLSSRANRSRYPCSTYCINRVTDTPDPIEALHVQNPDSTC